MQTINLAEARLFSLHVMRSDAKGLCENAGPPLFPRVDHVVNETHSGRRYIARSPIQLGPSPLVGVRASRR